MLENHNAAEVFRKKRLILMSGMLAFVLWMSSFVLNKNFQLCSNEYLWWALVAIGPFCIFGYLQYRCPSCGISPEQGGSIAVLNPSKCDKCGVVLRYS